MIQHDSILSHLKPDRTRSLSILAGLIFVLGFSGFLFVLPDMSDKSEETVTVRKVETRLPPPPEPPPPIKQEPEPSSNDTPTVDLIGVGSDAPLSYSSKPKMIKLDIKEVKQPEFDLDSLNLRKTLSVEFPVVGVQNLDSMPRIVSQKKIAIPRDLRRKGISRVETKVEIIIDERGFAYVKKLVDPVYPEMVEPIRNYIKNIKFTPPTKSGRPVQAVYMFEVNFVYRVPG